MSLNKEALLDSYKNNNSFEPYIEEELTKQYESKMQNLDSHTRAEVEKIVYLQSLDNLWREHLYVMDNLKTGIGLRGYNQKDPLTEYKKESYNLFVELAAQIKYTSIKMLQKIQLNANVAANEDEAKKAKERLNELNKEAREMKNEPLFKAKPVRNEPCPCGSGKKYKNCCGISGPKKGMLAK